MLGIFRTLLSLAAIAVAPLAAFAQTQDAPTQPTEGGETPTPALDWTVVRFTEEPTLIATAQFDNGIGLVARCMDGAYDVIINGLPPAGRRTLAREIGLQVGDDETEDTTVWTTGSDRGSAFSRIPARVARQLAKGGRLQIIVPAEREGGPRTRYVMELEPSSTAIERTLTACNRPLVDPRNETADGNGQDGLPNDISWVRQPRISFPAPVKDRMPLRGYVTLSCLVQTEGRLGDCQIESEHPRGYNLGKAVEDGIRTGRVRQPADARAAGLPFEGRMIIFTVAFSASG
jgi:hypothetical protein